MRTTWIFLVLLLVGCSSNGGDEYELYTVQPPDQPSTEVPRHPPKMLGLGLSVYEASFMEGDGHVAVSATFKAEDEGLDIATVMVEMPDGVKLKLDVSGLLNDINGTITTPEFDVATTEVGSMEIFVRLVDAAGDESFALKREFFVKGDPYTWMERATGLPTALNSITASWGGLWDFGFEAFIAVGDKGTIMTSDDGLTWTNEVSGTDVDLNFVTCGPRGFGMDCYAVGDEGTILRAGHEGWTIAANVPDDISLHLYDFDTWGDAFAVGTMTTTDVEVILRFDSQDGSWTSVEPLAQSGQRITDLRIVRLLDEETYEVSEYRFVATVEVPFAEQAKVLVSNDFLTWVEVFVSDSHGSTYSIEGSWVGGSGGQIYRTADGINWTQYATPADQSSLVAMINAEGMLMAHGFSETIGLGEQVGVATSDGGETWQTFVIGAAYEPRGLAYGDGRWVSVGQSLAEPGKGAIFTTQ